jgi:hypothetical protein
MYIYRSLCGLSKREHFTLEILKALIIAAPDNFKSSNLIGYSLQIANKLLVELVKENK